MDHDLRAEKYGVRLRPVQLTDAAFIVRLRNSPRARLFVGDSAADVPGQEEWLKDYLARLDDWYFIVETVRGNQGVGTLGVYNVEGTTGEWGRWILLHDVPAASASAWLALHICFDCLRLETVLGHVVETNKEVISLHQRMGYPRVVYAANPVVISGQPHRQVQFRATRPDWPVISANLDRYARMSETLLAAPSPQPG